jgi:DNA-binding NarL/FixJ family response regulator
MTGPVRLVIADDEPLIREGLHAIFDAAGGIDVVAVAATGEEAVAASRHYHPDVVLADIQMPRLDGLDAARQILAITPAPKVIMLTTFDLDEYLYQAMRAGASGFLVKDTPRDQLVAAVRTVAAGDALVSSSVARRLIERFVQAGPKQPGPSLPARPALSPREVDVWRALARGLSNAEIAGELFVSEATVKTHVARILAKLHVRDRIQAVIAAYETGLIQPGSQPAP